MEKTIKRQRVAIIILSVLLVFSFFRVSDTNKKIENTGANLNRQIESLKNEINNIYRNVDEKLQKEASAITFFNHSYGELNEKTMTVPVTVTVTPKEYAENSKVFLSFSDKELEMKKQDNSAFQCVFECGIFEEFGDATILVKTDNETRAEDPEWYMEAPFGMYLPHLMWGPVIFDESQFTEERGLVFSGELMVDSFDSDNEEKEFVSAKLVCELNNETVFENDLTSLLGSEERKTFYPINKTFPQAKSGDMFTVYLLAEDKYGFTQKIICKQYECAKDSEASTEINTSLIILDKNGNVMYEGEK